eukprot:TRINITY_DN177_c0_g1_i4.p1 TRINITY_DN177_c0_g1~~TRINITY_DN177_c0_g1_i4.p1  ORF type:complete len:255 (+),score=48.33 TRINITY_DN177_c0_g1_i4:58-765(+)
MAPRRVNVFARSDGSCLHDVVWRPESERRRPPAAQHHQSTQITADKIWPIIHNFMSLSREVDGGPLRRLVFRNPQHYAPTVRKFDPVVTQPEKHIAPVVIHVLSDTHFVVTVTEQLPDYSLFDQSPYSSAFTLAEFCENIMHLLRSEHAAFVAAQASTTQRVSEDASVSPDAQPSEPSQDSAVHSADSQQAGAKQKYEDADTLRTIVQQSEIAQMIDNIMNLVQLPPKLSTEKAS